MILCEAKGYTYSLNGHELLIETQAGRWQVDIQKRPIFIEHQHTDGSVKGESGIHWQPRMFLSLRDVVTYITKHDEKLVAEHIVSLVIIVSSDKHLNVLNHLRV